MMKSIVVCLLALAGAIELVLFSLGRILQPQSPDEIVIGRVTSGCIALLVAIAAGAFFDSRRVSLDSNRWLTILIIAAFVTTLAPHLALRTKVARDRAAYKADQNAVLEKFKIAKEGVETDLNDRIENRKPFNEEESFQFLAQIRNWDLSYRGLPDHSQEGLALLKKAIKEKVFNPSLKEKAGEPLWLAFSKPIEEISQQAHVPVSATDAEIIRILKAAN